MAPKLNMHLILVGWKPADFVEFFSNSYGVAEYITGEGIREKRNSAKS